MATAFLLTIGLIFLFSFFLHAFWLWLSCQLCGARLQASGVRQPEVKLVRVGFLRALVIATGSCVFVIVASLLAMPLLGRLGLNASPLVAGGLALIAQFGFVLVWLLLTLRLQRGNVFFVALVWQLFAGVTGTVLFFALKFAVMEAFVVPTGSMANTILGVHKNVTCPECGYEFAVNASSEVDAPPGHLPGLVRGCTCPNCRLKIDLEDSSKPPAVSTEPGDRILVGKGPFGPRVVAPKRDELFVFQYPDSPPGQPPLNYVARLIGLPGETIAIHQGRLYVLAPDKLVHLEDQMAPAEVRRTLMHADDDRSLARFGPEGQYQILRKDPAQIVTRRYLVYDNDHPGKDLAATPPRWSSSPNDAFVAVENYGLKSVTPAGSETVRGVVCGGGAVRVVPAGGETAWLRYRHLLRGVAKLSLITDYSGYNSFESGGHRGQLGENWVGDLSLECVVTVDKAQGELILELARGVDRFRAIFDLATGTRRLTRVIDGKEQEFASAGPPASLNKPGTYQLRMANVDERITVWVDDAVVFAETYTAPAKKGPVAENDLEPASIGVRSAAIQLAKLKLWRAGYYTVAPGLADVRDNVDWTDPQTWQPLADMPVRTFYVQPDHYFFLGDNSQESSDSRYWGLVPRNLLLGRPFFVYYPWSRIAGLR